MKKALLICLAISCFIFPALAQQTITGKITDASGLPLAGVTVKSLKTGKFSTSANDGSFSLSGNAGDELLISMVGYLSQQLTAGKEPVSIVLAQDNQSLMEVVLVGR